MVIWWNLDHLVTVPGNCLLAHLLCIKTRNSNTFNLSTCGRVGISESNPEQKKWYKWGSSYTYLYMIICIYRYIKYIRWLVSLCFGHIHAPVCQACVSAFVRQLELWIPQCIWKPLMWVKKQHQITSFIVSIVTIPKWVVYMWFIASFYPH